MSANTSSHLVKMANQIAFSIPAATSAERIASTALHISNFWSPLMKRQIEEYLAGGGQDLSKEASAAIGKMLG